MDEIQYVGEWTLPGNLGRFLIILAMISALASCVAYFFSTNNKDLSEAQSWRNWGRIFFTVHGASVLGIVAVLFYLISNHRFEYHYVWQHSSLDLPLRYLASCFWEGQEGSFLLWALWHVILGFVLMRTAKGWEAPVMSVFAITQVLLLTMIIGLWVGDYKIGTNPFTLLRDALQAPIFSRPDYLNFIEDGNGLNPLLQNYWMTIHPPTLFLGFSSTLVPFAYVIASLWKRDYTGWVAPVLPWVLFSTMILGVGILMGGAWAYESLTFGGFWAWDPVENASLVPWLTLIAGLHTLVAYRASKHGLVATFVLFIATFLLILYSTFLTRSGILGDTSVHAFTDLGMSGQLLFFMLFFVLLSLVLLAVNWRNIPSPKEEENSSSREFWMFIGALVFSISAIQICFTTSIPVFNKIFVWVSGWPLIGRVFEGVEWAPPTDVIQHYNNIQVWIAILLGLLSAVVQFFRYKNTDWKKFARAIAISAGVSAVATVAVVWGLEIFAPQYVLMMFAGIYAVVANIDYIINGLKGKLAVGGGSIAHIGFGLMLIGILISNYNQEVISINNTVDFGEMFDETAKRENILLRLNDPVRMGPYSVTYVGDTLIAPNTYYYVDYARLNDDGDTVEHFRLEPNAQLNPNMGIVANPDTRHYFTRDIYTHVTSVPDKKAAEAELDSFIQNTVTMGDTLFLARCYAVIEGLDPQPVYDEKQDGDIAVGLKIGLHKPSSGEYYQVSPVFIIRERRFVNVPVTVEELGIRIRVEQVLPDTEEFVLGIAQREEGGDFIIMKAIVFPYINVLWIGSLLTVAGFVLSIVRRRKEHQRALARG